MSKEKVTLTLDTQKLGELRALAGQRSLSSTVDAAIATELARLKHLTAVDTWLAELDKKHGAVPSETLEWAARIVDDWARPRTRRRKVG
jgi:hypothetical protein